MTIFPVFYSVLEQIDFKKSVFEGNETIPKGMFEMSANCT
jgi:hypothetical protein